MSTLLNLLQGDAAAESGILVRILVALSLVLIGGLTAILGRILFRRFMEMLLRVLGTRFPNASLGTSRIRRASVQILPQIVFWAVLLVFLVFSTEVLGLPIFTAWMSRLLDQVPAIVIAVLLVLAGIWLGVVLKENVVRVAAAAQLPYARLLGGLCQTGVVIAASVIAASQLGVDISFILVITGIVLGALLLSMALAFGLGATTMVGNIIACHYVRGLYQVGQHVEVNGEKGTITKITGAYVILETEQGEVAVPARSFSDTISRRLN